MSVGCAGLAFKIESRLTLLRMCRGEKWGEVGGADWGMPLCWSGTGVEEATVKLLGCLTNCGKAGVEP